jgi:hypothetical protein
LDEVEDDVQLNSRENEEQSSNIPSTNAFDMDVFGDEGDPGIEITLPPWI